MVFYNGWPHIKKLMKLNIPHLRLVLMFLVLLGGLARFYDLEAPWKRKGHYNYGGVHTQVYLHCLKTTPLSISHGIPHQTCDEGKPSADYYPNHPPTILFALWGWSFVFGESEAALRSFVALFSLLNIGLVFLIARTMGLPEISVWLATALQATFPGTLFFGTHNDFVCEFAMFFSLLAGYQLLKRRLNLACLITIMAGICAWPGYFGFAGLWAHQILQKKKTWPLFVWGGVGVLCGLGMMMWLHQTTDIVGFLQQKMVHQGYVESTQLDYLYPLRWFYQAWQYHEVLLGPWGLMCLVLSLLWLHGQKIKWKILAQLLALSGGGVLNAIVGHQFVFVHEFNYLYVLPAYALLIAVFVTHLVADSAGALINYEQGLKLPRWGYGLFIFFVIATYPFGRYSSNVWHDSINAIVMISVVGYFSTYLFGRKLSHWIPILVVTALVNISQMINWRNEPALDFDFCKQARVEFARTGQPVKSSLEPELVSRLYCQGIPVTY